MKLITYEDSFMNIYSHWPIDVRPIYRRDDT